MQCTGSSVPDSTVFLREFNKKSSQLRIPLSGSLDLTHRCNLRCVHCYLGPQSRCWGQKAREMSTLRILEIIDEITDAGCLHLLLTGGEPLVRDDFGTVYSYAKSKGLLVTVFSNGTTVTDAVLDLFADLPPRAVEISLYGSTAATYERITGISGSFQRCLKGIERLLKRNINIRLKTILMTLNSNELFSIADFAEGLGVQFRFDAAIFPRLDGDRNPLCLRVSPCDAVDKEFTSKERASEWKHFFMKTQKLKLSDALYDCGAGLTSFHITPYGFLQPCIMAGKIQYDLRKGSFMNGWEGDISGIRLKKAGKTALCNHCEKRHLCGFCPAFFNLENGSEETRSEYLCALGEHRLRAITNMDSEGAVYAEWR